MGFEHEGQPCGGRGDAASGQESSQPIQGPFNPHAGGVLSDTEAHCDLRIGTALEASQQDRLAVVVAERVHRLIQQGAESVPIRLLARDAVGGIHGDGGLFALGSAGFGSTVCGGGMPDGRVEPTGQGGMPVQLRSLASEIDEDALGDVLGRLGIRAGLSQRRRVDEVDMPLQQCFERRFVRILSKSPEEFLI
jgi:hypothetical protein